MRKAFADALTRAAEADPRLVFLTGDLGFQVFDGFREKFGPRYVNVGVAEAQLVDACAGLAYEGWRPIAYSIASFMTGRAFEQIRTAVAYPGLPVMIVGAGGGYTYSNSGVTHHAAEDVGLMSLLPGMTVLVPGDAREVEELFAQALRLPGPSYLRIGRYGEPAVPSAEPVVLGAARLLQPGDRVAVLSVGDMGSVVGEALNLLAAEGIRPLAYQLHTVKPLDVKTLEDLAGRVRAIVVVEEQFPAGGASPAIAQWLAAAPGRPRLIRLGAPDALALGSPQRGELRRRLGIDAAGIAAACRGAWRN